jgi:rhizosphere induced protein
MEEYLESRGPIYTLIVINNSSRNEAACLYQANAEVGRNAFPLAWFARRLYPNTRLRFEWRLEYCFVWGETGPLRPGVNFFAGQIVPADLSTMNLINLDYDGAFNFRDQMEGQPGNLLIRALSGIPLNQGAVGIGMSGAGTLVSSAHPNMFYNFTPRPQYRIAFGNFRQGDVLDVESIDNSVEIEFPGSVYTMAATLNPDNSWTISQVV